MKRFLIRLLEKQRIFIKPELFINIDKKFINVIYKEHKHFSEIKGHIVAACDSSIFDLPNVTLTRREFNIKNHDKFGKHRIRARKAQNTSKSFRHVGR